LPLGLTVDNKYIYICDKSNHRIQVLDKENGKHIYQWGHKGDEKEGEFYYPTGVLLDSALIYVGDRYRVQVFTKEGVFVQYIGTGKKGEEFDKVRGFCIVRDRLYVADSNNHRVRVFN